MARPVPTSPRHSRGREEQAQEQRISDLKVNFATFADVFGPTADAMSSPAHAMAPDESMGGDAKRPAEEEEGGAGGAVRSPLGPEGASGKSLMPPLPNNLSPAAAWKDVCEMARAMARGTDEVGFKRACDVLSEEEFLRARLTRVSNLIGVCHPPTCPSLQVTPAHNLSLGPAHVGMHTYRPCC